MRRAGFPEIGLRPQGILMSRSLARSLHSVEHGFLTTRFCGWLGRLVVNASKVAAQAFEAVLAFRCLRSADFVSRNWRSWKSLLELGGFSAENMYALI